MSKILLEKVIVISLGTISFLSYCHMLMLFSLLCNEEDWIIIYILYNLFYAQQLTQAQSNDGNLQLII